MEFDPQRSFLIPQSQINWSRKKTLAKSPFRPLRVPSCPSFWASSKKNKIQLKDPKFLKPRHQNWSRIWQIRFKKTRCSLKQLKKTDPWIPVLPSYPLVKHGRQKFPSNSSMEHIPARNIEQTTYLLDVPINSIEHLHLSWWFPTTLTFFSNFFSWFNIDVPIKTMENLRFTMFFTIFYRNPWLRTLRKPRGPKLARCVRSSNCRWRSAGRWSSSFDAPKTAPRSRHERCGKRLGVTTLWWTNITMERSTIFNG